MNIIIIGCGNIGIRHLESILNIKTKKNIYVVDPSDACLNKCRELLKINNDENTSQKYFTSIDEVNFDFEVDIAIVASSSNARSSIIKSLYIKTVPSFLILEKLLFTKTTDLNYFLEFFKKFDTKVFVNQWVNSEFESVTNLIPADEKIQLNISGSGWGLCCNSVHFIEWFDAISNRSGLSIESHTFVSLVEAKRKGFYEIIGSIEVVSKNGDKLILECDDKTSSEVLIQINMNTESFKLSCIMSGSGLSGSYSLKDAKNKDFVHRTKFQSERTETVIEELMHKGTSSLPDYQTSSMQHLLLYPLFDKYFSENGFDIKHGIPIT